MRKILLAALLAALSATAQTPTGTVNGRVLDSTSAPVSNAAVNLLNVKTGVAASTETNADGYYSFPLVQPGSYRLTSEKSGFQKFATEFELQVGQTARLDVNLVVGQVSESVNVSERAVLIESETSSLGQVIGSKQVADLPLNGRNPFALASLTAGSFPAARLESDSSPQDPRPRWRAPITSWPTGVWAEATKYCSTAFPSPCVARASPPSFHLLT